VKKANNAPPSLTDHTAVVWRDSMYVFGGMETKSCGPPSCLLFAFNFRKGTVGVCREWCLIEFRAI
jgi:hypothetical protein